MSLVAVSTVVLAVLGVPLASARPPDGLTASGPAPSALAEWKVATAADGRVVVTWTSRRPLPVRDARVEFRQAGRLLGYPTSAPGSRRQLLVLPAGTAVDPTRLAVWQGGVRLDAERVAPAATPSRPYVTPPEGSRLSVDPGIPGRYEYQTVDYAEPWIRLGGLPAAVEVTGHAVLPTDAPGERPLVVFLHGRHDYCFKEGAGVGYEWPCRQGFQPVPSHLGYDYLQRLLASQGYATVSVAANGVNAQDWRRPDGGASVRAALVQHHLRLWSGWADAETYPVDMSQVLLVGHSRGGEGVDWAATSAAPGAPFTVRGQVLIGATDFGARAAPTLPTVSVLPYCDGDVADLQGQRFVDVARDLAPGDTSLRSSVLVMGANHNYFNTEWTPGQSRAPSVDDWTWISTDPDHPVCGRRAAPRLAPGQQRAAGAAYVAGAAWLLLDGDLRVLPMYDGGRVEVPSAGDVDVRSTAIGGDRTLRRFSPTQSVTSGGAQARICLGYSQRRTAPWCGADFSSVRSPHWPGGGPDSWVAPAPARWALEVGWAGAGGGGGVRFARPWDLREASTLDARTVVDPRRGAVRLSLRLTDASGDTAMLTPETPQLRPLPGPGPVLGRMWAQTLRAPLQGAGGIDLSRIVGVEVVGLSAAGRVWLLDLAGRRARLPDVTPQRLPVVSVRSVRRPEGDGPGAGRLTVPMTVRDAAATPGRLRVVFTDPRGGRRVTRTVRLAAGETTANATMRYRADRRDDPRRTAWNVVAYPISGATTGRYTAVATVLDDDPPPRVSVTRVQSRLGEGRVARWKVVMSAKVDYDVAVFAKVVRGAGLVGRRLSTSDVPRQWLCGHGRCPGRRMPLWRHGVILDGMLWRGQRSVTLAIPTRRDRRAEGRRLVTVRVQLYQESGPLGRAFERTVAVVD